MRIGELLDGIRKQDLVLPEFQRGVCLEPGTGQTVNGFPIPGLSRRRLASLEN